MHAALVRLASAFEREGHHRRVRLGLAEHRLAAGRTLGRGGAGFPAGLKWGFMPKDDVVKYVCINTVTALSRSS